MPRGTYCKNRAIRRRRALDAISSMDLAGTSDGAFCVAFVDGADEMVRTAIQVYKDPKGFLKATELLLSEEFKGLALHNWIESVRNKAALDTSEESLQAVDDFDKWYSIAREFMHLTLAKELKDEGETPRGKARRLFLERRFADKWNDAVVSREVQDDEKPKVDLEERFGGFLS